MHRYKLTTFLLVMALCAQPAVPAIAAGSDTLPKQDITVEGSYGNTGRDTNDLNGELQDGSIEEDALAEFPYERTEDTFTQDEVPSEEDGPTQDDLPLEGAESLDGLMPEPIPVPETAGNNTGDEEALIAAEEDSSDKTAPTLPETPVWQGKEQEEVFEETTEENSDEEVKEDAQESEAGDTAEDISIEVSLYGEQNLTFTGSRVEPYLIVKNHGSTLAEGKDYELTFENNVNAGTALAHIKGIGSYSFAEDYPFEIGPHSLTDDDVQINLGKYNLRYNKHSYSQNTYLVAIGGNILEKGTDYTIEGEEAFKDGASGAEAVITGIGNCTGSVSIQIPEYEPMQVEISGNFVYGEEPDPSVSVRIGDYTLVQGEREGEGDYYVKTTFTSDRIVQVEVFGEYEGAEVYEYKTFRVNPYTLADKDVSIEKHEYKYTGSAIEPAVTAIVNGKTLIEGTDYAVQYKDNIKEGTASVTVTGTGNYTGAVTHSFTITAVTSQTAQITASFADDAPIVYDGTEKTPAVTVKADGAVIGSGYKVTYSNNINAGAGSAVITGSYKGTEFQKKLTFKICPKTLTADNIDIRNVFDNESIIISCDGVILIENTDYDGSSLKTEKAPGWVNVHFTGMNNYTGTVTKKVYDPDYVDPVKKRITEEDVIVSLDGYECRYMNMVDVLNTFTVTVEGKTLEKGKDYETENEETFMRNKGPVTIRGIGEYTGTVKVNIPEYLEMTARCKSSFVYGTLPDVPDVEIIMGKGTDKETVLIRGSKKGEGDYYIRCNSYDKSTSVGKYVYFDAVGSYDNAEIDYKFTGRVIPYTLKPADISLAETEYPETGSPVTPKVKVAVTGGNILVKGTDYDLSYENNISPGTAQVTVTGKGNYKGSVTKSFTIKKSIKKITPAIVLTPASFTYNGKTQRPRVTVKDGSTVLKPDDYSIKWPESIKAGTYKVAVTLKGSYSGNGSATYRIVPKKVTPKIGLSDVSFTYNGKTQRPRVTVKDGSTVLKSDDYSIKWPASVKAGTYKVAVTLKGSYSGNGSATYRILPKKVTPKIGLSDVSFTYNGKTQRPRVTVKDGSTVLKADDYSIKWPESVKAGTYKVVVTLKGSYSGTGSAPYRILPKKISPKIILEETKYQYDRKVKRPSVSVKNGNTLLQPYEYTVTYQNGRINVGTYKVTVTLKANYAGSASKTFVIVPQPTVITLFEPVNNQLAFHIKWKKQAVQVTGYQIQYSTDEDFRKNVSSVNIKDAQCTSVVIKKGIKAKTPYYLRIRTFKTVGETNYYSSWDFY